MTHTVVWISRKNYESLGKGKFSGWQLGRIFPNEKELILALSKVPSSMGGSRLNLLESNAPPLDGSFLLPSPPLKAILDWNDGACFRRGRALLGQQEQEKGGQQRRNLHAAEACRDKMVVYELQVGVRVTSYR